MICEFGVKHRKLIPSNISCYTVFSAFECYGKSIVNDQSTRVQFPARFEKFSLFMSLHHMYSTTCAATKLQRVSHYEFQIDS